MKKIFTKEWWSAAIVRSIRTFAQAALAGIGTTSVGFTQLDWIGIVSVAGVAAVCSLLTSIAGLPEVE